MYSNNSFSRQSDDTHDKQQKVFILAAIIFIVMIVYILRLFSMQIVAGSEYRNQSVKISRKTRIIPAERGEIYDRNSIPLVSNTESFAIDITPGEIPPEKFDSVILKLANYLEIPKQSIDEKIPKNIRKSYPTIEIKSNIQFSTVAQIAENAYDLPGVSWRSKPIRNYNITGSMSHILGYVGNITKDELKLLYNKGYSNTSIIGKDGIEKQYDSLLQGVSGSETKIVDAKGRYMNEEPVVKEPVKGKNLILTIDSSIQELAEKALGQRNGSAIVLKPSTGEILAMVSYPYYDLNIFTNSDTLGNEYKKLTEDSKKPLLNRAINATYPPASTFKVIMSTAAYAENAIPPNKKIECKGELDYGDRIWHCHIGKPGHDHLDLKNALAQSCNIYYWTLGRDYLGVDAISSYARQFGYGQQLGIDLPTSLAGFVPNALWKERRYHEKWVGGDTMNMSIGQSYTLVTPLHVADMMAMVVNKGKIYKPHILKQIRDTESVTDIQREILWEMNIPESVWNEVQTDLRYTITNGTAQFPLRNKIVQIAGKTGTAEMGFADRWHSWFVAYAPFDAPAEDAIVVVVSVEATNIWEWWAPYASNIIFQGYFAKQTYEEAVDTLGFKYLMKPTGRQE